jgi:hypothetical protein
MRRVVLSSLQPADNTPVLKQTGAAALFQGTPPSAGNTVSHLGALDDVFTRTLLLHWLNMQDKVGDVDNDAQRTLLQGLKVAGVRQTLLVLNDKLSYYLEIFFREQGRTAKLGYHWRLMLNDIDILDHLMCGTFEQLELRGPGTDDINDALLLLSES